MPKEGACYYSQRATEGGLMISEATGENPRLYPQLIELPSARLTSSVLPHCYPQLHLHESTLTSKPVLQWWILTAMDIQGLPRVCCICAVRSPQHSCLQTA